MPFSRFRLTQVGVCLAKTADKVFAMDETRTELLRIRDNFDKGPCPQDLVDNFDVLFCLLKEFSNATPGANVLAF